MIGYKIRFKIRLKSIGIKEIKLTLIESMKSINLF